MEKLKGQYEAFIESVSEMLSYSEVEIEEMKSELQKLMKAVAEDAYEEGYDLIGWDEFNFEGYWKTFINQLKQ